MSKWEQFFLATFVGLGLLMVVLFLSALANGRRGDFNAKGSGRRKMADPMIGNEEEENS